MWGIYFKDDFEAVDLCFWYVSENEARAKCARLNSDLEEMSLEEYGMYFVKRVW